MRIRTRIMGAALAVVAVANVAYTGYFLDKERREARARLQVTIDETNRLLGSVLTAPLYDGNVEQLRSDLDSFFLNPDIVRLDLRENRGDIAMTRERAQSQTLGELVDNRVKIVRGIDELGEIRVVYTTANIEQRLLASRDELILLSLASLLGLALVILYVARGVSRPVEKLTEAARTMAGGHLDQTIQVGGAEELAVLGESFVRMRDAIRAQLADLAEKNERLAAEVAQRREAEQERDRLISVLEATTDFVGMADPQGTILYLNQAARRMTGIGDKSASDVSISQLHPKWASEVILAQGIPTAIRDGAWSGETAVLNVDGREIPVSQVVLSHHGTDGTLQFLSTIIRDITERKLAAEKLRASEALLIEAQEVAQLGNWNLDLSTGNAVWSDEEYRLLGYEPGAVASTAAHFMQAVHPEDRDRVATTMQQAMDPNVRAPYHIEHRVVTPAGERVVEERGRVTFDGDRPVRMFGTTMDITARKQAEVELQQYREHLEELVEARTDALGVANRELEAFSYSVSHDLRAPLRAIDGFSRILIEDYGARLDAEACGYLGRVRKAVQRMGVLIDELLELSRLGRAGMHMAAVDLSCLAAEVTEQLRTGDPARTVQVKIASGVNARGDEQLLRLLLQNLLGNAWKYTHLKEHAWVEFGATTQGEETVYYVRDNGAGFDMAYADKLFQPFQRLHRSEEFEGTGVGLAIVARIIKRHAGRVWAEGKVGEGATFYFTLGAPAGGVGDAPQEHRVGRRAGF
jgi:PAS domain S-box-containing protein